MRILVAEDEMPVHKNKCPFIGYDFDAELNWCTVVSGSCDFKNGKCSGLKEFKTIKDDCK